MPTRMVEAAVISLLIINCSLLASCTTTIGKNSLSSNVANWIVCTKLERGVKEQQYLSSQCSRRKDCRVQRRSRLEQKIGLTRILAERPHFFGGKNVPHLSEFASLFSTRPGNENRLGFVIHRNIGTNQQTKNPKFPNPSAFFEIDAGTKDEIRNVGISMLRPKRKKMLMRRSLWISPFSFNLNNANNKEKNDGQNSDVEEDFPPWLRALKRWQFLSSLTVEEEREMLSELTGEKELEIDVDTEKISPPEEIAADTSDIFLNSLPLASLVNLEALLLANSQDDAGNNTNEVGEDIASDNDQIPNFEKEAISSESLRNASNDALATPLDVLPSLLELGDLNKLFQSLTQLSDKAEDKSSSESNDLAVSLDAISDLSKSLKGDTIITNDSTDSILKDTTTKIEKFLNDASSAISPDIVQDLILRASRSIDLKEGADGIKAAADGFKGFTEELAIKQGLDVTKAAGLARATTQYTTDLVQWANGVLSSGYVSNADIFQDTVSSLIASKPLFHGFSTVQELSKSDYSQSFAKAAELANLAGAIYQETIQRTHSVNHAIVANGTTADVAWMVTDSIAYEDDFTDSEDKVNAAKQRPTMVRTLTIRGYDATDENVDREKLLNLVCRASPEKIRDDLGVVVHSGLLSVARELYKDLKPFIDLSAPSHRLVLNGHSIGGSLSVLLLMLITVDYGADFVNNKVLRAFTFGSPPVATMKYNENASENDGCHILRAFGLKQSIVYGYVQPWDPIPRLFSRIDPLYPLIGDLGEDGVTLYASGPPRTLRPITRAILDGWEGWPDFRDNSSISQSYGSVGVQHLLMPEPIRYLTDRLVSVNIAVPPIHSVLRISSHELLPALEETFPLDVFGISLIPAALRSFIHHFYPAYMGAFTQYTNGEDDNSEVDTEIDWGKKLIETNFDEKFWDRKQYEAPKESQTNLFNMQRKGRAEDKNTPEREWTQVAANFVFGSI